MMVLKIKMFKSIWDELSGRLDWLKHHTTWLRAIVGVMYFLLLTILLSSNILVSTLNLEVGEPSPQLFTAPWTNSIPDVAKYNRDKEAAAKAVQPVYKADEEYMTSLTKEIGNAFISLRDAEPSDESISELRKIELFASLPESLLTSLIETVPSELANDEKVGRDIILNKARNLETGARSSEEIVSFRDRVKSDLDQSELSADAKVFFKVFLDLKVTKPTLIVDESTTEALRTAARSLIKQEVLYYKANQKIVGMGDIVDETIYEVLVDYGLINNQNTWKSAVGIGVIVFIGMASVLLYLYQYKREIFRMTNRLVLIGLITSLVLVIGRAMIALNLGADFNTLSGMLIPIAWATMTVAILVGVDIAIMVSLVLAVFVAVLVDPALSTSYGLHSGVVALFGGIVGVYSVSRLSQRSDLARAGIFVSAINVLVISGIALTSDMRLAVWVVGVILGIVNGLASSFLTVGALHWFESGFHITSSVRLLELSDPNRPLLKRLLMEAPGTYHHSILVGNLAEAAAEAVQADATLVRVAAMYHDIGKLKRPYFFIENQFTQDNPHDKIAPTLSSLIITSHVKDGLELAKDYKLPLQIQDIIAQHHGDSLVSFFYHKALEEYENVPEESFHYEGPKPQTKEAALVALADNVEAAVRSMKQPTPGRVEGFVRKIIKDKLNDGQLDQCDLTFQDLDRIAMAFVRVLSGIFHSRVEYPEMPNIKDNNNSMNKKIEDELGKDGESSSPEVQVEKQEETVETKVSQEG